MERNSANRNRVLLAVYILLIGFQVLFGYFFNVHFSFNACLSGPSTVKPKVQKHLLMPGQGNNMQGSERVKHFPAHGLLVSFSLLKTYCYEKYGFHEAQCRPFYEITPVVIGRAPPSLA